MKRWASLVLSALLLFSLAACGDGDTSSAPPAEFHENNTSQTPSGTDRPNQSEPVSSQEPAGQDEGEDSHILIAYFTRVDNTMEAGLGKMPASYLLLGYCSIDIRKLGSCIAHIPPKC